MEKLNFLTAGIPTRSKDYASAFVDLREMNLDGLELEFVRGVRISEKSVTSIKADKKELTLTAHAPFYVNLSSLEKDKQEASVGRILETAQVANELGAYSITYHAGFYMGRDKKEVFDIILKKHEEIIEILEKENNKIWIRPETTGKGTQWGDVDEIIELSKNFKNVLPCVDFSHLHARYNGIYNTYDEFCEVFEKIGKNLGDIALKNFHAHIAGIEYGAKGEKHHLNLAESDFNYKDLLKAFKTFEVCGAVICESPNIEEDCKLLKEYWLEIQ